MAAKAAKGTQSQVAVLFLEQMVEMVEMVEMLEVMEVIEVRVACWEADQHWVAE